ncbi:MucR family transcriptional regulator, partial [Methylobacterium sp. CCH5-D2]
SFEDGKPYKTLRRHLTLRGLTPEAYREKWGLPRDYPMTSASYSEQRSELARALGLGQQRRRAPEPEASSPSVSEPAPVAEAPKRRRAVRQTQAA